MARRIRVEAVINDSTTKLPEDLMRVLAAYQAGISPEVKDFSITLFPIPEPIEGTSATMPPSQLPRRVRDSAESSK